MAGFVRSVNGGGGGGGGFAPSGGFSRPVVRSAPRTVTSARPITVAPKATVMPFYDPSRVIDLDRLKVVKDLRQHEFAPERGETQTGDGGTLGPGGTAGGRIAPPTVAPGAPGAGITGGGGLALAAIAALLLLGG